MKKVFISSIVIGISISLFLFINYKKNESRYETLYLLQIGAYKENINVVNITKMLPSYFVRKEEDLYHVYIGVTLDYDNISKINYNDYDILIKKVSVNNSSLIKYINKCDKELKNEDEYVRINEINREMIKKYEEA